MRFSDIYGQPLSLTVAEPVPVATYGQYFYANQPQRLPTVFEEPDEEDGESDLEDCSERTEKQHNYSRNKADPENMEEVDSEDNFLGLWNSRATDMVENSFLPPPGLNLVRPQPVRIACPSTIYPLYRVEDTSDDADIHNPWKDFVFSKTAMNSTQTEENQDDDLMEGNQMSEA